MHCDSYSYRSGFSYTCTFSYGYTYAPNADGNCDSDPHTDSNTNRHRASDANGRATGYAHSTGSSYPDTAPVAVEQSGRTPQPAPRSLISLTKAS